MTIELSTRTVYGILKYYPSNELANTMTVLLGQKTLTPSDLRVLSRQFTLSVDGKETKVSELNQ